MTHALKTQGPTHFGYRSLHSAEGAFDGHMAFPKGVEAKDRELIAELDPNHLYNDWYVAARTIGDQGDGFEVSVKSRIQGIETPRDLRAKVVGTPEKQAEILSVFAARLRLLVP